MLILQANSVREYCCFFNDENKSKRSLRSKCETAKRKTIQNNVPAFGVLL